MDRTPQGMQALDRLMLKHARHLPELMGMAGGRMLGYWSTTVVASPALAAATVICTTPVYTPPVDYDNVILVGWAAFTVGTSGVSGTLKIVEGTTTSGTLVASSGACTVSAGDLYALTCVGVDTLNTVNNFQHSLTLTIGSGAAASTVSAVALFALCL